MVEANWPYGLMDKASAFGTKDCRLESGKGILQTAWHAVSGWRARLPKLLKPLPFPIVIGHLYEVYMMCYTSIQVC